jgi:hypothetical protein
MNNFTLLIQGPILRNLITMCEMQKHMNTVVSTWIHPRIDSEIMLFYRPNLRPVINEVPNLRTVYNDQNRYLQFVSTYAGLMEVDTEYVIKVRSDEYYLNLQPAIEKFLQDPNKILTNNVFFRKTSYLKYHPSDHMIIGRTSFLREVYKECIAECEQSDKFYEELFKQIPKLFKQIPGNIVPEQQFAMACIRKKEGKEFKFDVSDKKVNSTMKKHFEIIDVSSLGAFYVNAKYYGKFPNTLKFINPKLDVIKSLEEL